MDELEKLRKEVELLSNFVASVALIVAESVEDRIGIRIALVTEQFRPATLIRREYNEAYDPT